MRLTPAALAAAMHATALYFATASAALGDASWLRVAHVSIRLSTRFDPSSTVPAP